MIIRCPVCGNEFDPEVVSKQYDALNRVEKYIRIRPKVCLDCATGERDDLIFYEGEDEGDESEAVEGYDLSWSSFDDEMET